MNKIDFRRSEDYDVAYEAIKNNMPVETPCQWDDIASAHFGIDIPDSSDPKEQTYYAAKRNHVLRAINERAAANRENWRVYIESKGKTIIKKENSQMVNNEMVNRMSRVASAMNLILDNLKPMIGAEGIDGKDRRVIRQMRSLALGASMSIRGGIVSMQGFTKNQKLMLTAKLPNEDKDME